MDTTGKVPALDVFRTFTAVYRNGSFTKAAEYLAVTQPTVTNHISQLEKAFGRSLFLREPDGVTPTAAAKDMARIVTPHVDGIEEYFSGNALGCSEVNTLRIGGPHEFITEILLPSLAIQEDLPPKIEVVFGLSQDVSDVLISGNIDAAFLTRRPKSELLHSWPVMDEEFLLVGSPQLVGEETIGSEEDLKRFTIVAYDDSFSIVRRYWTSIFGTRITADCVVILPNLISVKSAVIHGMGISVLPDYLVKDEIHRGELVALDSPEFYPLNTIYLAVQRYSYNQSSGIRESVSILRRSLRDAIATLMR